MDSSTEESDSRTAAFTNKRKQPSSLQFEHHDSDSAEKRLKLEALRPKYSTLEPGEIFDATSFSRRPSKDSATNDEVHQAGSLHTSGWTLINANPAITNDLPFKCDQCSMSFRHNDDLKKHKRIHSAFNHDPFVNPHQHGHAPGADGEFADGMASTTSHQHGYAHGADQGCADGMISTDSSHYGYRSMAALAGLDRNTYAHDTKMQETILKKVERVESLSNEEYIAIARWLARNDTSLTLSDISNSGLTRTLRTKLSTNSPVDQVSIAGALESLSYDPNPYWAARKFLKDRYWSVTQYVPMAKWLESNDDQLSLHDIQSAGLKAKVKSMLKAHNLDERGGVAKVLGMISLGGDYHTPTRAFIKQRYEGVRQTETGAGGHNDSIPLNSGAESDDPILRKIQKGKSVPKAQHKTIARWLRRNDEQLRLHHIEDAGLRAKVEFCLNEKKLRKHDGRNESKFTEQSGVAKILELLSNDREYQSSACAFLRERYVDARNPALSGEFVDAETNGRDRGNTQAGRQVSNHDYQYMVQWLETHLDGPKLLNMQDSDLKDRVRKMMKSKHMEEDANIAVILSRLSQHKNKLYREGAQAWLKEYYESACRAAPDTEELERDPLSKEGWVERALVLGEEYQTDAVGIIRLDDVGWKPKIQQEVAKHASRCTRKSVEEILREAVVRKWRVRKHAARRLRSGYQSQKVTDGPRLDILQSNLPDWSLEELEKVMTNQTGFLRPLVGSDVIQRAAHSAFPAHVATYMQSLSEHSFAQCLLEVAKRNPDDGFSQQCLADFVTINYVGGEGGTYIHSRDGVEDLMQLKAASQPCLQPVNQGEQQLAGTHSNRGGSTPPPPPPPPTPPEPFDYDDLAQDAAARNASYPDAIQAREDIRSTDGLDQDSEMEDLQAYSADYEYLQRRYFHTSDTASFCCLCCGKEGHIGDSCPLLTCNHCGAVDDHFSGACPTNQKCGRCRKRDHLITNCMTPSSSVMPGLNEKCDICGRPDHVEEECSELWRSFLADDEVINLVPEQTMRVSCYNCGAADRFGFRSSHWGDDCPKISRCDRNVQGLNDTFSAKHADKFVQKNVESQPRSAGHGSIPRYQLAMLGD